MKKLTISCIISSLFIILAGKTSWAQMKASGKPRTLSFDQGWRFTKANQSGAENESFDDSRWRKLDLPHDWSIEDLPGQDGDSVSGPFSKASIGKMGTAAESKAWQKKLRSAVAIR